MTIDESITELKKARDSIEPCLFIDEAIDQSMKTAINIMCKYQKIKEIVRFGNAVELGFEYIGEKITEVMEDDNGIVDNSSL